MDARLWSMSHESCYNKLGRNNKKLPHSADVPAADRFMATFARRSLHNCERARVSIHHVSHFDYILWLPCF